MYRERVVAVLEKLSHEPHSVDREKRFDLVREFMKSVSNYMTSVCIITVESTIGKKETRKQGDGYEKLCSKMKQVDDLADDLNLEKIYSGPKNRDSIEKFCVDIMDEYFQQRLR